jgi:hypothetical protein
MSRLDYHVTKVQGKMLVAGLLVALAWSLFAYAAVVWLVILVNKLAQLYLPLQKVWFYAGLGVALAAGAAYALWRRPTRERAAVAIDERLGLNEKFSTALYARKRTDPFAAAAVRDAESTAERVHLQDKFPVKFPLMWVFTVAIALAAVLTQWRLKEMDLFGRKAEENRRLAEEKKNAVANQELRQALAKIEAAPPVVQKDPNVQMAARELKQLLGKPVKDPTVASRRAQDALEEVRSQMQKVEQIRQAAVALNEMKAWKELASKPIDESGPVGQAHREMSKGEFSKAIDLLKDAVNNVDKMSQEDKEKAAQQMAAMAQQLKDMANNPQQQKELEKQLQQQLGANQQQAKQMAKDIQDAAQGDKQAQKRVQQMANQIQQQMNNGQGPNQQQIQQAQQALAQMQKQAQGQAQAQQIAQNAVNLAQLMQQVAQPGQGQQPPQQPGQQNQPGQQQQQQQQAQGGQQQQQAQMQQAQAAQQQGQNQPGNQAAQQQQQQAQAQMQQQLQQMQAMADAAAQQQAGQGQQQGQQGGGDQPGDQPGQGQQQANAQGNRPGGAEGQGEGEAPGQQGRGDAAMGGGIAEGRRAAPTPAPFGVKEELSNSATIEKGKLLASNYVKASALKGESKAQLKQVVEAAETEATDEVDQTRVSRQAREAVKEYHRSMQKDAGAAATAPK